MIKIQQATEKDAQILALLGRIAYTESHKMYIHKREDLLKYNDEAFSVDRIKEDLMNSNLLIYLMFVDDLPVGYGKLILGSSIESVSSNNNCRLDKIYVLEDFIHLKLGQRLLQFLEEQAQTLQLDTIWLVVYVKNIRAIKFYEKNDFKAVGKYDFLVNGTNYKNTIFSKEI